ncbi:MAG: hypothetical protein JNN32_01590 [Flavobacteriales bacterium]|nr:hypothetical protein [Flavobacteriales bacterium]
MKKHLSISVLLILVCCTLVACIDDKREGLFGRSETIDASRASGHFKALYIPNKHSLTLRDGTVILLDTAWAESLGTYDQAGELASHEEFGYTIHLPISGQNFLAFTFALNLLDKNNEAFTNGMSSGYCDLKPAKLLDTIAVELWERHTADSIGWTEPNSTDTVLLIRQ